MELSIRKFEIFGLYEERNVSIDFDSNTKIIVAENGYGKTTVLNAFYSVLAGDLDRLRKMPFSKIAVTFNEGEPIELTKESLSFDLSKARNSGVYHHLRSNLSEQTVYTLIQLSLTLNWSDLRKLPIYIQSLKKLDASPNNLRHWLKMLVVDLGDNMPDMDGVKDVFSRIKSEFSLNLLYLPTYRRVEEDLQTLGMNDDIEIKDDHQINFGMSDVRRRIKTITSEILSSSVEWFSIVNGEMIAQLVEGFKVDEEMYISVSNLDAIKIVLDRIGENIPARNKEQIIELVNTGKILEGHDDLVYFLANLVKVYEQQKDNDSAIQEFTNVCNEYLVDKKIQYNESNVTISVVRVKNNKPVDWENLSSGEKQIVSLFARLYLDRSEDLAIFFDEPELSLSIEWQRKLLPHILNSKKCKFLFCTTHSPFIFDNELDSSASDLAVYVEEL
ncbi:AAA family ATPase [Pseudoalteromonas rubra]|uniref:ATP-binding protein n=1 Tax=Pseudoalteromonas rubra TaxID=43658 RepID=A0A5S3WRL8_9GAMM|nr:AAA family ATPase [Pseudoalteromonas rubra]TMP30634.1 ATP-binding protein [Pseudoalteromonas rubra]